MRPFSVFGSLWLALIVITITVATFIALDLRLLGAGRTLGRGTRAGSEHAAERWRESELGKGAEGMLEWKNSSARRDSIAVKSV